MTALSHIPPGIVSRLRRWTNTIAAHYYAPVYVVGSALRDWPVRDVDIVIELSDERFEARYAMNPEQAESQILWGISGAELWAWSADCYKKSEHGSQLLALSIDFKVLPISFCQRHHANKPKFRLDECPDF